MARFHISFKINGEPDAIELTAATADGAVKQVHDNLNTVGKNKIEILEVWTLVSSMAHET